MSDFTDSIVIPDEFMQNQNAANTLPNDPERLNPSGSVLDDLTSYLDQNKPEFLQNPERAQANTARYILPMLSGGALSGAALSGIGELAGQKIEDKPTDWLAALKSAVMGGVSNKVGEMVSRPIAGAIEKHYGDIASDVVDKVSQAALSRTPRNFPILERMTNSASKSMTVMDAIEQFQKLEGKLDPSTRLPVLRELYQQLNSISPQMAHKFLQSQSNLRNILPRAPLSSNTYNVNPMTGMFGNTGKIPITIPGAAPDVFSQPFRQLFTPLGPAAAQNININPFGK
jgi:hypothetical protein